MYITIHIPEMLYEKIKDGKADKKTLENIILWGEVKTDDDEDDDD